MDEPTAYQIKVRGELDESWSDWFGGMTVTFENEGDSRGSDSSPTTTLTGPVADQAALRGLLTRIWDLNLALISLVPIDWEDSL